jgi:hypothetical protein
MVRVLDESNALQNAHPLNSVLDLLRSLTAAIVDAACNTGIGGYIKVWGDTRGCERKGETRY